MAFFELQPVLGAATPRMRVWSRSVARGDLQLLDSEQPWPIATGETLNAVRSQCQQACRAAVLRPESALQDDPPALLQSVGLVFRQQESQRWQLYCEVSGESYGGVTALAMSGVSAALLGLHQYSQRLGYPAHLSQQVILEETRSGLSTPLDWLDEQERAWFKPHAGICLAGRRCAVVVLSDRAADGHYPDRSGPLLIERLRQLGAEVSDYHVLADDPALLQAEVRRLQREGTRLCLLSGGTGLGPRDCTPDALQAMGLREVSGFGEAFRSCTAALTPLAWLSRANAYQMERMLLLVLPGSPRAVAEGWDVWQALLAHALAMMDGGAHP